MVRIAHFTDATADGVNGIATSIRLLNEGLSGHDTLVVSTGPLWRRAQGDAIRVPALPTGMGDFRFALAPLRAMRDCVRRWQPDVAHVHTPGPLGAAGLTVARELGIPAVYTYHTDMHGYSAFYYYPTVVIRAGTALYARALPRGDGVPRGWGGGQYAAVEAANARVFASARVIVLPTAGVLRHCRTADAHADRVRVIPTPPGHRPSPCPRPAKTTILYLGRVSAEKGIPLLLDAFAQLRETHDARLILAGPVARRLGLARRLARAGLTDHTVVTGTLRGASVVEAYQAATVFAFPSTTDTQGLVLHEAALAGLPIVMVDRHLAAGHPLGPAALLADPAPDSLAEALRRAVDDPGEAGRRGREIAYALTPGLFARRMLDAYREALRPADRESADTHRSLR